jgi:serine phosphatase RsbU (regulator of sigma subunit)
MGIVVAVVAVLLIGSGLATRAFVDRSFTTAEHVRTLRTGVDRLLVLQIDEETGIRGFAATRQPVFLQPYFEAEPQFVRLMRTTQAALHSQYFTTSAGDLRAADAIHDEWQRTVALPLRASPTRDAYRTELRGKQLIDRFRAQISDADVALIAREENADREARRAIDLINVLVALATIVTLALGFVYARAQRRSAERLEQERIRADAERERSVQLRSAYEAEKRVADLLQDAIAQRPLPTVPTLRFSATYVPATEETKVGGDWYDALELPERRVLFAIGDVAGHGIEAAVTMSRARQALITSAVLDADPSMMLSRVNQELVRQGAPMVTAVAGYADARTFEFVFAVAGHPPPVLVEPNRKPRLLECGGLPLGIDSDQTYRTYRVQSVPGAMLVLYTDGAVEHSRNVLEGETLLLEATARVAETPALDPASVIHEAIFGDRAVGDDVAILTIGFLSSPGQGLAISADNAQASFAAQIAAATPVTAGQARVFARAQRRSWAQPARKAS